MKLRKPPRKQKVERARRAKLRKRLLSKSRLKRPKSKNWIEKEVKSRRRSQPLKIK